MLQQDGTLQQILGKKAQLQQVLSLLCGVGKPREIDEKVRTALAEALLMLVRLLCLTLRHQMTSKGALLLALVASHAVAG